MDLHNKGKKCLCCLELISQMPNTVKLVDCAHELCFECFNRWKRIKDTCPLCRTTITKISEITLDKSKTSDEEGRLVH